MNILQIEMRQRPLFSFPFFFVTRDYTLQVDCDHTHFTMQTHDDSTITFGREDMGHYDANADWEAQSAGGRFKASEISETYCDVSTVGMLAVARTSR